jgi:hypothetical protein
MVELRGRNFGPRHEDMRVYYGPQSDPFKYTCNRTWTQSDFSDSTVRCNISAGSGALLQFVVELANGQQSIPSLDTFSYPAPVLIPRTLRFACISNGSSNSSISQVTSVTHVDAGSSSTIVNIVTSDTCMDPGTHVNATSTTGGDVLQMDADFLGPSVSDIVVTYSRPFFHSTYVAEVLAEGTTVTSIRVRTVAGIGRYLTFQVNVSGQTGTGMDMYHYPINASTVTSRNATYKSIVRGDSISSTVIGAKYTLHIQSYDTFEVPIKSAGAVWIVSALSNEVLVSSNVTDNLDGTYHAPLLFTRR